MADCSKTLEYAKELDRMCKYYLNLDRMFKYYLNTDSKCNKCPLKGLGCRDLTSITQNHIAEVQTWSDCHPIKTRQSEFLKMYPHSDLDESIITICPWQLGEITLEECSSHSQCDDCRKKYWMEEIE